MATEDKDKPRHDQWAKKAESKEERKVKARKEGDRSVWFGLGMFGLVGWSVAVPTVVGALLGYWLDEKYPGARSWTLMGIVIGVLIGCLNAWRWMNKEGGKR
ncbi:AtpZ/AtpI family protein [Oceanidesulfovibrio indonesiensis]|uniref:AtpZ/AtpI family protein n=1 Tax=Oceanidesulfovibrio indonesiensis TaxID=54767 RepID=UPI001F207656|nr:AtpZ/AtpI family protein [Oceanidesulfovibrio indonesiensis]